MLRTVPVIPGDSDDDGAFGAGQEQVEGLVATEVLALDRGQSPSKIIVSQSLEAQQATRALPGTARPGRKVFLTAI